jgi:tyrosinase
VIEQVDIPCLKLSVGHVSVAIPDNIDVLSSWFASKKDASVTSGRPEGASEDD